MTRYEIIRRETADELVEAVNSYLNIGWILVGGLVLSRVNRVYTNRDDEVCSTDEVTWAQAIVRTESGEGNV